MKVYEGKALNEENLMHMSEMECGKLYRISESSIQEFIGDIVIKINPDLVISLTAINACRRWNLGGLTPEVVELSPGENITLEQE